VNASDMTGNNCAALSPAFPRAVSFSIGDWEVGFVDINDEPRNENKKEKVV